MQWHVELICALLRKVRAGTFACDCAAGRGCVVGLSASQCADWQWCVLRLDLCAVCRAPRFVLLLIVFEVLSRTPSESALLVLLVLEDSQVYHASPDGHSQKPPVDGERGV